MTSSSSRCSIFAEHEAIRKKWQQRLEYIMIDEFQDIDEPQYRLMNVLCGWHKNLSSSATRPRHLHVAWGLGAAIS